MPSFVHFRLRRDDDVPQHWHWMLRGQNDYDIAASPQAYTSRSACLLSTGPLKQLVPNAPIYDEDGTTLLEP